MWYNTLMKNIRVFVKPGSRKGDLVVTKTNGALIVYLRARPFGGAANTALVEVLSDHFDIPKTSIKIKRGVNSRIKLVSLDI